MLSRFIISIFFFFEEIYKQLFRFKSTELTKRIFSTLFLIFLIRIGIYFPIPGTGINFDLESFQQNYSKNELATILNLLSGGGFLEIGFFTLGILPYMNASFFLQVLVKVLPSLERFQKEQEEIAQRKFKEWTHYLTFVWALIQSIGIVSIWIRPYALNWDLLLGSKMVIFLTLGALIVMFIAEEITELGLTNGASVLIFINIIARIPISIQQLFTTNFNWTPKIILGLSFSLFFSFITMFFVIALQDSARPVPVFIARQEAERQKLQEDQRVQPYLFFQLLPAGIMPIIFASTIFDLAIPAISNLLIQQGTLSYQLVKIFSLNPWLKDILYILTIVAFSSSYATSVMINPKNLAETLNRMNVLIQGVRPGSTTEEYAERLINRLNLVGSFLLGFVCVLPLIFERMFGLPKLQILSPVSISIIFGVAVDASKRIRTYANQYTK